MAHLLLVGGDQALLAPARQVRLAILLSAAFIATPST